MASRNEARETKREMMPIVGTWGTQRENACHGNHGEGYAAPICLIPENFAVLFRSVFFIFRSEMPFRSVKDCRVGRKMRPPRNDTKLAGFMKKPASFLRKL